MADNDDPKTDEPTKIGPHLLGRHYVPDSKDWSVEKLHRELTPPASLLDETVGQAIGDSPFFQTWRGILALWRWIKNHLDPHPTPPGPQPGPDTSPAWDDPVLLDQGNYGTCVGNGWAGWLASTPVQDAGVDETEARAIYYESTVIGGSPDDPDAPGGGQQGSTVRDGAKAVQARARLVAYAFAQTLAEIDEWLNNHGPVVMGTDWTNDMFNPSPTGYVRPTGGVAGGHCYLLLDKIDEEDAYLFQNSWGNWGPLNGRFKMKSTDVLALLTSQGEACCAAELPI